MVLITILHKSYSALMRLKVTSVTNGRAQIWSRAPRSKAGAFVLCDVWHDAATSGRHGQYPVAKGAGAEASEPQRVLGPEVARDKVRRGRQQVPWSLRTRPAAQLVHPGGRAASTGHVRGKRPLLTARQTEIFESPGLASPPRSLRRMWDAICDDFVFQLMTGT